MARKPLPPDWRLLSKVSKLYYEQNLNQQAIAEKLHLSRPKVSRLIQQAQEEGVVRITVYSPPGVHADLEERLEQCYGLKEAMVVDVIDPDSQDQVTREIGHAAANYLQSTVQDGDIIGISWGTTLSVMVGAMKPMPTRDVHVVQMIGGLGAPQAEVHATSLCRRLTEALDSSLTLLHAPGVVDSPAVKQAILSDSHMQEVQSLFSRINVAYVGIGAPTPNSVVIRDGDIMSQNDLDALLRQGAVGDIALRYFDSQGQPIHTELDNRIIGITLDELKRIPRVVGVAGGPQKVTVVRSALRGRLVNVLITDERTACSLLEEDGHLSGGESK